jgi:hypothetical protein
MPKNFVAHGVAKAQTFRKALRLLKPEVLNQCFGASVASRQDVGRGEVGWSVGAVQQT